MCFWVHNTSYVFCMLLTQHIIYYIFSYMSAHQWNNIEMN